MSIQITPSRVHGEILIPSSKSHSLRAILFGMLAEGRSEIRHFLESPDAYGMIAAARLFGAQIHLDGSTAYVEGIGTPFPPAKDVIDAGNSGIILRFIGALAGISSHYTVITGDHSIRTKRPVKPLIDALNGLGAHAHSLTENAMAPLLIKGPLRAGKTRFSGVDSQPVSGILIACALSDGPFELEVESPGETPWIDVTLHWMQMTGLRCEQKDYTHYKIPGGDTVSPFTYTVPGDFSSAAFPLAAALITQSELTLCNLDMDDVQGDKKIIDALKELGAHITTDPILKKLTVYPSKLSGGELDINEYIDALPILSVLGCFCTSPLKIYNAHIARQKESDRVHAIATELKKMGANIEEHDDGLTIYPSKLNGAHLESYKDHRIVLSLACAALGAQGQTQIANTACISKTYPTFVEDMQAIGVHIQSIP